MRKVRKKERRNDKIRTNKQRRINKNVEEMIK